jgi:hypothetical protein
MKPWAAVVAVANEQGWSLWHPDPSKLVGTANAMPCRDRIHALNAESRRRR